MKIAFFIHCFFPEHYNGTEVYTLELARRLQETGHQVVVVTAKFKGEAPRRGPVTRFFYEGVPVICFDKNHFLNRRVRDTYYQEAMREPLREILNEIRPDIVHVTHLLNHTAVLLEVLKEMNIPSVATLTDFFGICYNNQMQDTSGSLCQGPNKDASNCLACHFKERSRNDHAGIKEKILGSSAFSEFFSKIIMAVSRKGILAKDTRELAEDIAARPAVLKQAYHNYSAVIAPSAFLKKMYESHGFKSPVYRAPYGVDLPRLPKIPVSGARPLRFCYVGQIAGHKGVHVLLEAFRRIPGRVAELHVYGSAERSHYMDRLSRQARGCPVVFHGSVGRHKMAQIYSEADFVIIPSTWYENCPFVLIESLAQGTPVIASDVPGMSEFIKHGENGFLFPRGDAEALYAVLRRIIDEPQKSRSLSGACSYAVTSRDVAGRVLEIYESVLGLGNRVEVSREAGA